jgi:hypothetical protein
MRRITGSKHLLRNFRLTLHARHAGRSDVQSGTQAFWFQGARADYDNKITYTLQILLS